jgi:hypothetical protein
LSLQYGSGETFHGLRVSKFRIGWSWDWIVERFRFGLGPNIGYLSIERATTRSPDGTVFLGLDVHASFDFAEVSDLSAFFVSTAVKVDGGAWGPVLQLGYRGDVVPSSPSVR